MPTVVPSQILMYIDTTLSDLVNATPSQGGVPLQPSTYGALNALLRLIEQLPNHLLPSDPNLYAAFIQNQESIRFAMKQAENHDSFAHGLLRLTQHGPDKRNPVQIIRAALFGCPDEVPPHRSNELPFIEEAIQKEHTMPSRTPPTIQPKQALGAIKRHLKSLQKLKGSSYLEAKAEETAWEHLTQGTIAAAFGKPSTALVQFHLDYARKSVSPLYEAVMAPSIIDPCSFLKSLKSSSLARNSFPFLLESRIKFYARRFKSSAASAPPAQTDRRARSNVIGS